MDTPIIDIRNLTYEVSGHTILEDISLEVYPGEILAVIGMSGTGKTTLLRLITGLIHPTAGTISVLGEDISGMGENALNRLRARLGLVFQFGALFDSLNVRENVGFRLYERTNLPDEEVRRVVAEKLRLVGMPGTEDLMPSELSGGMQKRVGIARALVGDPPVLLYDEPTSGLDPVLAANIDALITRLRDAIGVTEVIVSHDVTSVLRMADRMAMLYDGRVRMVGTTDEFRATSDPVVRQFLDGETDGPIQVV
jgi:phospholipid/cholesterol/gamma-HCH transport system ATP-binding protein